MITDSAYEQQIRVAKKLNEGPETVSNCNYLAFFSGGSVEYRGVSAGSCVLRKHKSDLLFAI